MLTTSRAKKDTYLSCQDKFLTKPSCQELREPFIKHFTSPSLSAGATGGQDSFLCLHAVAAVLLLPTPRVLQPGLPEYAVLWHRCAVSRRRAQPRYRGDGVPRRINDRADDYQCVPVVCTAERVWGPEESVLSHYRLVINNVD